MSKANYVPLSLFLKEREDRYSPEQANELKLRRIEKIDFSGKIHLADGKTTRTGMILVRKGDLIVSGINVEKGAIAVYRGEEDVLATIHYSSYSFDEHIVDVKYFEWFLRSTPFRGIINSSTRGGIKTELKSKGFLSLLVPLPNLDMQVAARTKLDSVANEIREIIDLGQENEEYVQKLRQQILQEAISGNLVPQDPNDEPASELLAKIKTEKERQIREGKVKKEIPLPSITREEIPFSLPKGWDWAKLGNITLRVQDGTHSSPKNQYKEPSPNRYLYITSKNIKETGVDTSTASYIDAEVHRALSKRCKPELSDILMIKDGAITGRVTLNDIKEEFTMLSSVALIRTDRTNIENRFLLYYLRSPTGFEQVTGRMTGSAITRIILKRIKNTIVPLPPLSEQRRIVRKVDQLMELCDELEERITKGEKNSEFLMEAVLKEVFAL